MLIYCRIIFNLSSMVRNIRIALIITLLILTAISIPISLAETNITVRGKVTDLNNSPVPGLKAAVTLRLIDVNYTELATTKTNSAGEFTFPNVTTSSPSVGVWRSVDFIDDIYFQGEQPGLKWFSTNSSIINADLIYPSQGFYGYAVGVIEDPVYHNPINGTVYIIGDTGNYSANTKNATRMMVSILNFHNNTRPPSIFVNLSNATDRAMSNFIESGDEIWNHSEDITDVQVFAVRVPTGDYTIYAVHNGDNGLVSSRPINITVGWSQGEYGPQVPTIIVVSQHGIPENPMDASTQVSYIPTILPSQSMENVNYTATENKGTGNTLPSPSSVPTPGFTFVSIAILCCLVSSIVTVNGVLRKKR